MGIALYAAAMLTIVNQDTYPTAWCEAGSGKLALFLHGLGGSRTSWAPQLTGLSDLRRCVAWDMPGYGASSGLPGSLEDLADAAAALILALGEGSADVVGLSMGGMIAQHLSIRHPQVVRTLTLLDTSPAFGLDGTTRADWLTARLAPFESGNEVADVSTAVIDAIVGPNCTEEARQSAIASMNRIPIKSLTAACTALVDHDVRARIGEITVPTKVVVGADDDETPLAYAQLLAAGIPGAQLQVIPACGHLSNIEAPQRINALITQLWTTPDGEKHEH